MKAMYRVMNYMINTPKRGRLLTPDRMIDDVEEVEKKRKTH
jgi:hypothetical protein